MSQVLSSTTQSLKTNPSFLPIAMAGLASSLIVAGYLAQEHPAVAVPSSLLNGFAPLLGLCLLIVVVSLLVSFLVCTVERTLTDQENEIISVSHDKSKWHLVAHCPSNLLAHCLSLKEHSPPAHLATS